MRILGIDPGYAIVGFGILDAQRGRARLVRCGAITTPAGVAMPLRLLQFQEDMETLIREFSHLCDLPPSFRIADGAELELTQREFELLTYLASNQGKVFSRQELMERVWNYAGYVGDVRGVDVAVRRLREKVEDNPATPRYIITRRGVGYLFERPEDE